ncbi:MAG: hypothetical protein EOP53_02680, partial [Sphingobacteriales bacterium]
MQIKLTKLSSLQFLQVLRFGALFLGSVCIAKLVKNTHLVGEFENLVLVGSSFTFFWSSGFINTFIPFYQRVATSKKRTTVSTTFILLSFFSLVFGSAVFILKPFLFEGTYGDFTLYITFAFLTAPTFLTEFIYLSINKPKAIFAYAIVVSGLHFACVFFPLILGFSITGVLFCLAFLGISRYLFAASLVLKVAGSFRFDNALAKNFLRASLPVVGTLLLGGSMLYIDSYIVRFNYNTLQFAIFQYGARELPFVLLMASALSNVASAEVASHHAKGNIL